MIVRCVNVAHLGSAVRRHCHSTGDMLNTSSTHVHNTVVDLPPVRLRHNRPKSEGSFCGDKMRVKRASSFGVRNCCRCFRVDEF